MTSSRCVAGQIIDAAPGRRMRVARLLGGQDDDYRYHVCAVGMMYVIPARRDGSAKATKVISTVTIIFSK